MPGGREDIFADKSIDLRSTRSLMKFLKLGADAESHPAILENWGKRPFPEFLSSHLNIPVQLQAPLLALTSSPSGPADTLTAYALPRIHRHLTSMGMFGPGFGSVIPKWGGLAEIAQVACRAGAVGGGTYVLKKGIQKIEGADNQASADETAPMTMVQMDDGETIKTRWIAGTPDNLPNALLEKWDDHNPRISRSITIVSTRLQQLFPAPVEGAPPSVGAVVVFPTSTLALESASSTETFPPVYLMIHSSDTGECPSGQCKSISKSRFHPQPLMMTQNLNTYLHCLQHH